jgi:hypothetical protein
MSMRMFRSCRAVGLTNGHPGVSFLLFRFGLLKCLMVEEYDRATRTTLAFSGERGKWGAFAAGSKWGAVGVSRHAGVSQLHAFKPHPQPARRDLDRHPRVPRVARSCSRGQRDRELFRNKHHERSGRRDHDQQQRRPYDDHRRSQRLPGAERACHSGCVSADHDERSGRRGATGQRERKWERQRGCPGRDADSGRRPTCNHRCK